MRPGENNMSSVEPAGAVWSRVIANLDQDPCEGLNTARECCERFASDRGRLALVVRHADGRSERWTYFELARESARLRPAEAKALVVDHRWRDTIEDVRAELADDLPVITIAGPRGTGLRRGD